MFGSHVYPTADFTRERLAPQTSTKLLARIPYSDIRLSLSQKGIVH